jgi:oligosaccharide repeat unit polymerase
MLATLEIQVSWSTYPDRMLGFGLFLVSVIAMLMGFLLSRQSGRSGLRPEQLKYSVKIVLVRKILLALAGGIFLLVVYNYISFGLPPVAAFFGFSALDYQTYGRFKQVLQPMASALFINSLIEPSRIRRWLGSGFALGVMIAYVLRGPLLLALGQGVILSSIRSSASRKKIYVRALVMLMVILALADIIGSYRIAKDLFLADMEIKPEFRSWPTALLWPITYISVPPSNLCWVVHGSHFTEPTLSFLYPLLPSFWAPPSPDQTAMSDPHIIDGVCTYLALYFLDFSWPGIVAFNFLLGLLSGILVTRERISRYLLISPVFLTAFGFIFFADFFVNLAMIIQLFVQALVQRLCIVPGRVNKLATGRQLNSLASHWEGKT